MTSIAGFFQRLYETTGVNLSPLYDPFDGGRFLAGLSVTVELSALCILLSLVLGVLGAWLHDSPSKAVRVLVRGYVQAFRNTPPLVQLAFFYFALSAILPRVQDSFGAQVPLVSNFGWAVISFSLFAGAFNVEIFRSGMQAVPSTMVEAAEALGYSRAGRFRHVVMPLALRVCLPALNNNLVNLLKTTTLASAIGVPELLYAASQIWSESMNVREMMNLLLVSYLVLVGVLVFIMHRLERALRIPGYGA